MPIWSNLDALLFPFPSCAGLDEWFGDKWWNPTTDSWVSSWDGNKRASCRLHSAPAITLTQLNSIQVNSDQFKSIRVNSNQFGSNRVKSVSQSINQTANQSNNQWVRQQFSQSANHLYNGCISLETRLCLSIFCCTQACRYCENCKMNASKVLKVALIFGWETENYWGTSQWLRLLVFCFFKQRSKHANLSLTYFDWMH